MNITAKTQMCIIIGDPVEHSLSPKMHNAAYTTKNIDDKFVFTAAKVAPSDLETVVKAVRAMGIKGLTCTIPHKVEVMQYLDEIDPVAKKIGAVNTVVNDNGHLKGYNTDWLGTVTPLEKHTDLQGKKTALIGAGGAARGIAFGILEKKGDLTIYNRTIEKAEKLAKELSKDYEGISFESLEKINQVSEADIIINATSIGMAPHEDKSLIPAELIQSNHIVFDAVYTPYKTKLLRDAQSQGATTIPGLEMLLHQGTAQFSLYTGVQAPEEVMRQSLIEHFNLKT